MFRGPGRTRILTIVLLLVFLSACSSLQLKPPGADAQTILILPFTAKNTSGSPYGYYYQYTIVREGDENTPVKASFKLPNSNGFLAIDSLSPGTYFVTEVTSHAVGTGGREFDEAPDTRFDPITLAPRKISIFRKSINITQKSYGSGGQWLSNYRISSSTGEHRAEILEKLKQLENFDLWEVMERDLSFPKADIPDDAGVVARFPAMSVGDSWVANHRDDARDDAIYTYEVAYVDPDGSFDLKVTNDKNNRTEHRHFDSGAPWIRMFMGLQFDPRGLQFPLFVGKAWNTETQARSTGGDYFTYRSKYVVEDFTTISTRAGDFEAFRIASEVHNVQTSWRGLSTYWYAPAARSLVKSSHMQGRGIELLSLDLVE